MRRTSRSGVRTAGLLLSSAAIAVMLATKATAGSAGQSMLSGHSTPWTSSLQDRPAECPPCFDCHLPRFNCLNSGKCNEYDGQCVCPPGFGGLDCGIPLGKCERWISMSSRLILLDLHRWIPARRERKISSRGQSSNMQRWVVWTHLQRSA